MPSITRAELDIISGALKNIIDTAEEIRRRAPQVGALCDNILRVSQPAEKTIEQVWNDGTPRN